MDTILQPHNLVNIFLLPGKTLVSVVTKLSDPLKISCLMYTKEPTFFLYLYQVIHILIQFNISEHLLCMRHFRGDNSEQDMVLAFRVLSALNHCLFGKNPRNPSFVIKSQGISNKRKIQDTPSAPPLSNFLNTQ